MDTLMAISGILLVAAGLTGVLYGVGINVPGMMSRGATDYSFITAYIMEWSLVLISGLALIVAGVRRK